MPAGGGWRHWITETLWPSRCPACGIATPEPGAQWCHRCAEALAKSVGVHYCRACGATTHILTIAQGRCRYCTWRHNWHTELVRVGQHQGPLRKAILAFKYRKQRQLANTLAKLLLAPLQATDWFDSVELLVPVPSHWLRTRWRGYHHVGLLAARMAAMSGKQAVPALRMARRVRPQVGLSRRQRLANIRGAFRPASWVRPGLGPICVVDDVMTTGATLREATRALKQAQTDPIYAAVIAKTGFYDARLSLV